MCKQGNFMLKMSLFLHGCPRLLCPHPKQGTSEPVWAWLPLRGRTQFFIVGSLPFSLCFRLAIPPSLLHRSRIVLSGWKVQEATELYPFPAAEVASVSCSGSSYDWNPPNCEASVPEPHGRGLLLALKS